MIKVEKKGDGAFAVTELFKNPDFGAHRQPPVMHGGHLYAHYTTNERKDGLVAMSLDGQVKWKTDSEPSFVRGARFSRMACCWRRTATRSRSRTS